MCCHNTSSTGEAEPRRVGLEARFREVRGSRTLRVHIGSVACCRNIFTPRKTGKPGQRPVSLDSWYAITAVVPPEGIEPSTRPLRAACSTTELRRLALPSPPVGIRLGSFLLVGRMQALAKLLPHYSSAKRCPFPGEDSNLQMPYVPWPWLRPRWPTVPGNLTPSQEAARIPDRI